MDSLHRVNSVGPAVNLKQYRRSDGNWQCVRGGQTARESAHERLSPTGELFPSERAVCHLGNRLHAASGFRARFRRKTIQGGSRSGAIKRVIESEALTAAMRPMLNIQRRKQFEDEYRHMREKLQQKEIEGAQAGEALGTSPTSSVLIPREPLPKPQGATT